MEFPTLSSQLQDTLDKFQARKNYAEAEVRYVISPYRICPLGAHVDHQGGNVLGKTINAYTLMAFVPLIRSEVRLYSANYPGLTSFQLDQIDPPDFSDWGRYARGAAYVLNQTEPLRYGLVGLVNGTLPGSGLSSSASVGLAYLHALARINNRQLTQADYVELDRLLENEYLGLGNGILDQATIVYGRSDALLHINTRERTTNYISDPDNTSDIRVLIVYSGDSRELAATGYNDRVGECQQAARLLGEKGGIEATILSDIPSSTFENHNSALPDHLQRRAAHYFTEVDRVAAGCDAWTAGDFDQFGALMNASCASSIHQYESGSEAIKQLQKIVSTTPGVFGSRFGGGGFGGCVIGLADSAQAESALHAIKERYLKARPDKNDAAAFYLVHFENGVRFLNGKETG